MPTSIAIHFHSHPLRPQQTEGWPVRASPPNLVARAWETAQRWPRVAMMVLQRSSVMQTRCACLAALLITLVPSSVVVQAQEIGVVLAGTKGLFWMTMEKG